MFGSDLVTCSLLAGALLSSLLIGPMLGSAPALADQSAGQNTAYLEIQGRQVVSIRATGAIGLIADTVVNEQTVVRIAQ